MKYRKENINSRTTPCCAPSWCFHIAGAVKRTFHHASSGAFKTDQHVFTKCFSRRSTREFFTWREQLYLNKKACDRHILHILCIDLLEDTLLIFPSVNASTEWRNLPPFSLAVKLSCCEVCMETFEEHHHQVHVASKVVTSAESTFARHQIWLFWKSWQRKRGGSNTEESWEVTLRFELNIVKQHLQEKFMAPSTINSMPREHN